MPLQFCGFQSTGFQQDWDFCGLRQDSSPVQFPKIVWSTIQINWIWSPLESTGIPQNPVESSGFTWGAVKTSICDSLFGAKDCWEKHFWGGLLEPVSVVVILGAGTKDVFPCLSWFTAGALILAIQGKAMSERAYVPVASSAL